eukprot:Gb_04883 [translate_table: standard]
MGSINEWIKINVLLVLLIKKASGVPLDDEGRERGVRSGWFLLRVPLDLFRSQPLINSSETCGLYQTTRKADAKSPSFSDRGSIRDITPERKKEGIESAADAELSV